MVQLRRMPLATMSPASTPSLLKRCRLGLRIKEFIHSPVAASTDLLFGNRIFLFFFFRFRNSCVFSLKHFRNNFPCHQVRQKSFDVRAVIIREIINIPPWEFRLLAIFYFLLLSWNARVTYGEIIFIQLCLFAQDHKMVIFFFFPFCGCDCPNNNRRVTTIESSRISNSTNESFRISPPAMSIRKSLSPITSRCSSWSSRHFDD